MAYLREILEKERWNEFLERQKSFHILESYEWGEFKSTQGWRPRRFILEGDGEVEAVYPVLERKVPLMGFKFWYLPRGPVGDFRNPELFERTIDSFLEAAKKNRVAGIKINLGIILNKDTEYILSILRNKGFREGNCHKLYECTIELNLENSLEEIFAGFKKNTRWEIRKSEKDGVRVREEEGEDTLDFFYQLYLEALKGDKVGILPYGYFENFLKIFKNNALVLIAFLNKIPLSAALVSSLGKKCFYMFGGSTKRQPTHYASQFLQWEAIKWAKSRGCCTYDFYGIPCGEPKNKHDIGILGFKSGFGGKKVKLIGEMDYSFSPFLHKIIFNSLYLVYQKIQRFTK